MEQVLAHFGLMEGLNTNDEVLSGDCPLCHGHGFVFNRRKNTFACRSCGKRGSVLDFTAAFKQVGLKEAALLLEEIITEQGTAADTQESPDGSVDAVPVDTRSEEARMLAAALQVKIGEVNELVQRLVTPVGASG